MMSEKLNHYLNIWTLSDPQPLASTRSSEVYTVLFQGTRTVLKILKPAGEEEKTGAIALRHFNGRGAVQVFHADDHAQLLEYVDGPDLVGMVKSGQDEQATAIIADVLNRLHESPETISDVETLDIWFRELFKKADQDQRSGISSLYIKAAAVAKDLLAHPQEIRVLHGDIHHQNIRYHAQRGWLAFDPKGLVGERTYDAANTLCNPIDMQPFVQNEARLLKNASILAQKMHIDLARILSYTFAYVCLSASWNLTDDPNSQDAKDDLRLAEIIEPHLSIGR